MKRPSEKSFERGIHVTVANLAVHPNVELFGHVTLVEGYAVPGFSGCHALIALRDQPGINVAVLTSEHHLQSLLETALSTGNLIAFHGQLNPNPPTPLGGSWGVTVYSTFGVILYNMQ